MLTGEMYKCKSCKSLQTVREFLSLDEGKAAYYVTCLACGNSYLDNDLLKETQND